MSARWVYRFDQMAEAEAAAGGGWDAVKGLLGGKGANLGEMARLGVPVPPGFTITSEACQAYLAAGGKMPDGLVDQIGEAVAWMEEVTGRRFGDPDHPLLVSCRSGAKFSMPGMMDTVLDIGLDGDVVAGLARETGDRHFAFDTYRRLVQMFGSVVLGHRDELFEQVLADLRTRRGVATDAELTAEDLEEAAERFRRLVPGFPDDPRQQLLLAAEAVFSSWNGKRAVDYREATGIPHDLGTAVNIQAMVFGNLGDDSATGVMMTRDGGTGEPRIEGDYLINAQGEDVVAGIRATKELAELETDMPAVYGELAAIAARLEAHHREMQDMEFTVERGKLWILQTRDGKRTAQAAVRIAVDMAEDGLITREEAVGRVTPEQVDFFLHPQLSTESRRRAVAEGRMLGTGLDVSPGAAVGQVVLDPDLAVRWHDEGRAVVLARAETKPDDVHGMIAAEGILTSRGGRTSHAALVARQFGKPAVVGLAALQIDPGAHEMHLDGTTIAEGDWVSIDGTTGEVFLAKLDTFVPDLSDPWLVKLLGWADGMRRLGVRANADYPADAERARSYGAEGIGLCRTEHMFFEESRLPTVQRMIMAVTTAERREALDELLPLQRGDFTGLFEAMDGLPVVIRLMDPPLHEFLPAWDVLVREVADRKIRLRAAGTLEALDEELAALEQAERMVAAVERLREANPMLGLRGVRLSVIYPEITRMQARAIMEAACGVVAGGGEVDLEVMIPLAVDVREVDWAADLIRTEAEIVFAEQGRTVAYRIGTMIETPRAALTAGEIAATAEFFSFGTNDLTQTTFAISRDDAEASFLTAYVTAGVLPDNPFATLDDAGVGALIRQAVAAGRAVRPDLEVGICGEHGGDPGSIALCHAYGLDYVSCSPFRVPVARLAAAHAALADRQPLGRLRSWPHRWVDCRPRFAGPRPPVRSSRRCGVRPGVTGPAPRGAQHGTGDPERNEAHRGGDPPGKAVASERAGTGRRLRPRYRPGGGHRGEPRALLGVAHRGRAQRHHQRRRRGRRDHPHRRPRDPAPPGAGRDHPSRLHQGLARRRHPGRGRPRVRGDTGRGARRGRHRRDHRRHGPRRGAADGGPLAHHVRHLEPRDRRHRQDRGSPGARGCDLRRGGDRPLVTVLHARVEEPTEPVEGEEGAEAAAADGEPGGDDES